MQIYFTYIMLWYSMFWQIYIYYKYNSVQAIIVLSKNTQHI